MHRDFTSFAVVVLLLCSASIPIRGQGDGTVAGQVMDEVNAISLPGSPAITGAVTPAIPPSDGFFDPAPFVGAVGPAGSGQSDWLSGWTDWSLN